MRVLVLACVLAACGHASPIGTLRFKNQAPVWRVDDRQPLAAKPHKRDFNLTLYQTDGFIVRRATRALELRAPHRARDVNSLDEVPDSTWFTNRIGVRDMTLDEIRRGAGVSSPFEHLPWTITGPKPSGTSLGFMIEDATGSKYIVKFAPEMETVADIVVDRVLYAAGYNVPEDFVGEVRREDLRIRPGAKFRRPSGDKVPLTDAVLENALSRATPSPDGRMRVLASKLIPGAIVGPYAREGTRPDDRNDVIPHEDRRSLRGQYAIFAWLAHTDVQEDNSLDAFVDGHLIHYVLDFDGALGVMAHRIHWKTVGFTYRIDLGVALRDLITLGLLKRPWDTLEQPDLPGIGLFDAEHYRPGEWRETSHYWPLDDKDRFDAFWGAKLLMRFTREQIAAIVDEAKLSDPRSAAYLVDTLVARQRMTARYWFDRVAPLDQFEVRAAPEGMQLAFTDLLLAYHLGDVTTNYLVDTFDRRGHVIGTRYIIPGTADGRVELGGLSVAPERDGYTIVRVRVLRKKREMPAVLVHVARGADGTPRVIGLRRY